MLTTAVSTDLDLRDIRVLEELFEEAVKKVRENEMINKEAIFTRGTNEAVGSMKLMIGGYINRLSGIRRETKSFYAINHKKYDSGAFHHLINAKDISMNQAMKDARDNGYYNTFVKNNLKEVDQNSYYALRQQNKNDKEELGPFEIVKTSNSKGNIFIRIVNYLSRKSAIKRACRNSISPNHRWDLISEAVDKQRPQFISPIIPKNRTETPEDDSLTQQSNNSKKFVDAAIQIDKRFGGIRAGSSILEYQPLMENDDERQALVPVNGPVQRI